MMQLLVIVLNKLECLDKLLTALEKEHIPGATCRLRCTSLCEKSNPNRERCCPRPFPGS